MLINQNLKEKGTLPVIVPIVLLSTLLASIGGEISGIHFSGIGWLIPFFYSIYLLISNKFKLTFPVWTYIPWGIILLFNLVRLNYDNSLQRIIMLLCPIIVGCAASTLSINESILKRYIQVLRYFCIGLFIVFAIKSKVLFTFSLPNTTPLAAEVMIGMILISVFSITYFNGEKSDRIYLIGLLFLPFIALTRMAMMTTALTLPLNFSNIKLFKRLLLCGVVIIAGVVALNTERVQKKMFYSDSRHFKKMDIIDLFFNEGFNLINIIKEKPNLATSGRSFVWKMVNRKAESNSLIGKGVGACENYIWELTYKNVKYPHNDYILTYFDMGLLGLAALVISILLLMYHTFSCGYKAKGSTRILLLGMSYSFIPFMLMMITDNILVYASFFGNLQYCTIGLAYACYKKESELNLNNS